MLGWIVRIAVETAMRSSEITGLRKPQGDLERRVVTLYETKNTMPRTVPLSKRAMELFRQALANPVRPKDCELVFLENQLRLCFPETRKSLLARRFLWLVSRAGMRGSAASLLDFQTQRSASGRQVAVV